MASDFVFLDDPRSSCRDSFDAQPWEPVDAFRIGGHFIGVRGKDATSRQVVNNLLGAFVADVSGAPALYSLDLSGRIKLLHRGCTLYARSRDTKSVLRALVAHLLWHDPEATGHPVTLDGVAVETPNGVIVCPEAARDQLLDFESRLRPQGIIPAPAQGVSLAAASGEVVLPTIGFDETGMWNAPIDGAGFPVDRLPVRGWLFAPVVDGPASDPSPAEAVLHAATGVTNVERIGAQVVLDTLAAAVGSAVSLAAVDRFEPDLAGAVERLARIVAGEPVGSLEP